MKIGIVGYANKQGLGIMNQDFIKYLDIKHQLVIPSSDKGTDLSLAAENHILCKEYCPSVDEILNFCKDVDVIFCVEATYSPDLFKIAKSAGKRTVFYPMWEWFDNNDSRYQYVDMFICSSMKCFSEVNYKNKTFLPWPVDTGYFYNRQIKGKARTFLHCAGFGGMNWRKSTNEVVEAFTQIQGDYRLIINTQLPVKEYPCAGLIFSDSRISVFEGTVTEKRDLYSRGDVLIAPHKCDGQFLVGEEGMASGLPVITTNAPPMNEFGNFLVDVKEKKDGGYIHSNAFLNIPDIDDLKAKIRFCTENEMERYSRQNRELMEKEYSWDVLGVLHKKIIEGSKI